MCGKVIRNWEESVLAYCSFLEEDKFKKQAHASTHSALVYFCFISCLAVTIGTKYGKSENWDSSVTTTVKLRM